MPQLIGERIMLREYRAEDIHAIRSWVNDAQTTRYLSTRFWPPQTEVDSQEFLSRMLQSSHNAYNFVIADLEGNYIGQLDLFRLDWRLRLGELGMVIARREDRGQGIGQEALGLLQRFAFRTLGLERLELEVHMDNAAALACYRRAGFTLEGVKRHAFFTDGHFCDVGMMSILRDEYEARS
ncbi:MAG: GNAT family N-acetyltransferase [Clostridia bacterium]|nr:GNAT family N-acetyltransferase [Clostridia bacterium]